jgi:ATPase
MKLVPDTSVIVDGRITSLLDSGEYRGSTVIIPEAVLAELESQANRGLESGFNGLDELCKIREMARKGLIELTFAGKRPGPDQIKLAKSGEIDHIIRQVALDIGAVLVTSDRVQSMGAKVKGLEVIDLFPQQVEFKPLIIEKFFTPDTLSVHLKDGVTPFAKKGSVKDIRLVRIGDAVSKEDELRLIARELIERGKRDSNSFIEMEKDGATVLQIGSMRVAIATPPFSDGIEITAVRPVADVRLDDYRLSEELKKRLACEQRGVVIAGPPGAGKSTFAAGVAEFLQSCNKIVKTMESPRDLQVDAAITQYSPLEGSMENTADVLLLVRPDYTIYDEVRKTRDFQVFADMRLAGVGMVGVVHANRPVDAIQRLIGRVELGMIPQVVDTVIFINQGEVASVHDIKFTVKVPQGMTESDLARPVITITDFETGTGEFEIYTYGEQVVVMPTAATAKAISPAWDLAARKIDEEIRRRIKGPVTVEMNGDNRATVLINKTDIPSLLGKGGRNIAKTEERLGIHLDVRPMDKASIPYENKTQPHRKEIVISDISLKKKHIVVTAPDMAGVDVDVIVDGEYLFTATVGRRGDIRIIKDSEIGERLLRAFQKNLKISICNPV